MMQNDVASIVSGAADFGAPELLMALAEDAETLALLHDRELTPEMLNLIHELSFPEALGLLPQGAAAQHIWALCTEAVRSLPTVPTLAEMDELAADYAAIYLTGAYGASPCESVWVDEDHLVCQESMFQLRDIYAAAGLATPNWRHRPDDHLVLQLLYIAHAVRQAKALADWAGLAKVMDEHLLRWLPDFARQVASRCTQPFYAGLVLVTDAWCDQVRDLLAHLLDEPRPSRAEIEARLKVQQAPVEAVPLRYMPGVAPSW